jgi:hypothetical protein
MVGLSGRFWDFDVGNPSHHDGRGTRASLSFTTIRRAFEFLVPLNCDAGQGRSLSVLHTPIRIPAAGIVLNPRCCAA